MTIFDTWLLTDLQRPLTVALLPGSLFTGDDRANRINVRVYDGGQAASLAGTVTAYLIRSDDSTLIITGTLAGDTASITLPEAAYICPGPLDIVIKLTGQHTATIGACRAYVTRTSTDTIADPDRVIPSLDELLAMVERLEADMALIEGMSATAHGLGAQQPPTVTVTRADGHYNLDFGIPKGDTGVGGVTSVNGYTPDAQGKVTIPAATDSADGLLSAGDKAKLNDLSYPLSAKNGGTGLTSYAVGDILYASGAAALSRLAGNATTTRKFLRSTGSGSAATAPVWDTLTKSDVGLGNVENTALSTWTGSANITTLGTISSGTWQGTAIAASYIGNHSTDKLTSGTLPIARGGTGLTSSPSLLVNLGSTAAANVLTASPRPGVTGTLGVANGGTGAATLASGQALIGNGTGAVQTRAITNITSGAATANTNLITANTLVSHVSNYAPTKTGTGASGTWGIDITGIAERSRLSSRLVPNSVGNVGYASNDTHYMRLGYIPPSSYGHVTLLYTCEFWGNQHGSSDIIDIQYDNSNAGKLVYTSRRTWIGGNVDTRKFYIKQDSNNRLSIYVYVTGGNSYGAWNTSVIQDVKGEYVVDYAYNQPSTDLSEMPLFIPLYNGVGASGTWPISITGSAASVGGYTPATIGRWKSVASTASGAWATAVAGAQAGWGEIVIFAYYSANSVVFNIPILVGELASAARIFTSATRVSVLSNTFEYRRRVEVSASLTAITVTGKLAISATNSAHTLEGDGGDLTITYYYR